MLDLHQAYLQIHTERSLWLFQTMEIKRTRYCFTQLGFGLNVAPNIMMAMMNAVRVQDGNVQKATSPYINDVFINEHIMSSQAVTKHFEHFRLTCKEPELLQNGAKVLGLHISGNGKRQDAPEVQPFIIRQSTYTVSGKLVDYFPVCGWLRVVVAVIKQRPASV